MAQTAPPREGRLTRRDLAIAALASLLLLLVNIGYVSERLGFLHKPRRVAETDHYRYLEMAQQGPAAMSELAREDPFCWRVLVPYLAGALARAGLSLNAAFYGITNASLFGFLFVSYLYWRRLAFAPRAALLGVALVGLLQGAVRWYEYQYWMTDPTCLLLVALGVWLVHEKRAPALFVITALTALVRETVVLLFPFYFVRAWRYGSLRQAVVRTAALAAAPLLILVALRLAIPPPQPNPILAVLHDALSFRWRHLWDNQLYLLTIGSWGVLLPLALLSPRRAFAAMRRQPEDLALLATVYLSLAVANNTERLLAYALPVVVPHALAALDDFAVRARLPWTILAAMALALQALLWVETRLFGEGMSLYQPTNLVVVGAMALFWVGAQGVARARAPGA